MNGNFEIFTFSQSELQQMRDFQDLDVDHLTTTAEINRDTHQKAFGSL